MKKLFLITVTIMLLSQKYNTTLAQSNLIYNSDFELYDTCPTNLSSPSDYQIEHCLGWKSPTYATSDYFNVCNTIAVGVPYNYLGFQYAYSGNAYCGILLEFNYGFWFEYIQSKLLAPLKVGYEYEFSCRIVFSDLNEYAYWKFGAAFTQQAISKTDAKPFIGITPQVMNQPNNFITDTLNWVEIKGKFFAQGGEEYITLGFFSDTTALDTLRYNTTSPIDPDYFQSYYYIDAGSLSETENTYVFIPNAFSPNGDGENDFLEFYGNTSHIKTLQLIIYDRWGEKVFETDDANFKWDGTYNSKTLNTQVLVYYLRVQFADQTLLDKKGNVSLIK